MDADTNKCRQIQTQINSDRRMNHGGHLGPGRLCGDVGRQSGGVAGHDTYCIYKYIHIIYTVVALQAMIPAPHTLAVRSPVSRLSSAS